MYVSNLNIVEILKVGLPGLIFLLSLFSYTLLTKEQKQKKVRPNMIKAIWVFTGFNFLFAVLTVTAPFLEKKFFAQEQAPATKQFTATIKTSATGSPAAGHAIVCLNSDLRYKFILIKGQENKMIQVFSDGCGPFKDKKQIIISDVDAKKLGLDNTDPIVVQVAVAQTGYQFHMNTNY